MVVLLSGSRRNRRYIWIGTTCGVLALGLWLGTSADRRGYSDGFVDVPKITGKAWFNVAQPLSRDDLQGRPILLEFWATWCPPCIAAIPKLNELQDKFADRGLLIIGVTEEPPEQVASFVKQRKIRYPVCSGLPRRVNAAPSFPYAVLVSPKGKIVWQGDGRHAYAPLFKMMKAISVRTVPKLIVEGEVVGYEPNRPEWAEDYDYASLLVELETLQKQVRAPGNEQLQRLFKFYWNNLPRNGWSGDELARVSASAALLEISLGRDRSHAPPVLRAVRQEILKRLSARDPDWTIHCDHIRSVGYLFPEGDIEGMAALEQTLADERNPLVRLNLEETLERLDPARPSLIPPESALAEAMKRYNRAAGSFMNKLWGYPRELASYERYKTSLQHVLATETMTQEIIHQMIKDYRRYPQKQPGDLLIRNHIMETLSTLINLYDPSDEIRELLQKDVFLILKEPETDWQLRLNMILAQSSVGFDLLDSNRLLERVEAMLLHESVRSVKANLEYLRLQIVAPDTLTPPHELR